jgi:methylmalonyl-CoA/ethylmalonyl-CoA epimerase
LYSVFLRELQVIESLHSDARLHHVGFAIRSIKREIVSLGSSLLASWDGEIFHDRVQKVRVTFLKTPTATDALVELIEPAADDSPIEQFLKKGGGLHHLCYEVPNLETHLQKMQAGGVVVVKPPFSAVAFENRLIAWVVTRQKLLLELLEQKKA